MFKKILTFGIKLGIGINEDNLLSISYELTYKLLMAMFPLLIFLMSILGFLELDINFLIKQIPQTLPKQVLGIVEIFIDEVIDYKSATILSSSLILTIYSASSGFLSLMKGINKTYQDDSKRNFIINRILSIFLVLIFVLSIIILAVLVIYVDKLHLFLIDLNVPEFFLNLIFSFSTKIFVFIFLIFLVILIFKISSNNKASLFSLFPGACVTVILWYISSIIFNIYINNFSKYSKIYGSIGSIFILMLWLNLISFFLLFGSKVNAISEIT